MSETSETASDGGPRKRSLHEGADKAIESMREVAATLKTVGDELVESERQNRRLRDEAYRQEEKIAELEHVHGTLTGWSDFIDAFRLDLIDKAELLERTIGRP